MSTLKLDTLSNKAGTASVPSDTIVSGTAKAWVNFDGQGTVSIRESFNVSSITDVGTGTYYVNWTNVFAGEYITTVGGGSSTYNTGASPSTTTYCTVLNRNDAGTYTDPSVLCAVAFGVLA